MRSSPTLAQLRAFVAIAEIGHFRDAAASLRVSQPTLSQALSALEAGMGLRLIERTPRRVLVTADGHRLLPIARGILEGVEAFRSAASPTGDLSGSAHLGIIPTVAPYLLPALLTTLADEAPALRVHVHEDQTERLLRGLATATLDAAILALPISDPGVRVVPLYEEELMLAVPPGHAWDGTADVAPESVDPAELLLLDKGHCLRDQVLEVCLSSGGSNAGAEAARAASLGTIVQLVAAGYGVTVLPATGVPIEAARARLGIAHFAAPSPTRTIVLAHRRTSSRAGELAQFAEVVRAAAADVAGARPLAES